MKITAVRIYQDVHLGKTMMSYFNKTAGTGQRVGDLNFELIPAVGVRIESSKDCIIVPFANIASITLEKEAESVKKSEPEKKSKAV